MFVCFLKIYVLILCVFPGCISCFDVLWLLYILRSKLLTVHPSEVVLGYSVMSQNLGII